MPQLALVALAILAYALTAVRLDRLSISGPIVLVTVGALLGPAGVGAVTAPATSEPFRVLAELTLALLLFSDASTIGLREAGGIAWLPGRLLAFGLPLTIAGGALVGWLLFPALGVGFALVLGSILAPTDAALSLPVLLDRAIPVRIRRAINIESGLNDGIAAPFVTLSLAIAVAEETAGNQNWLIEAGEEIALAIVVAIVVGGLGGRFTSEARRRGWASQASESLAVVALAIFAYAGATAIGGNGFVAAFGAGIAFRTATARSEPSVEFAESIGLAASYLVWLLFGVALVGPVITAGFDPAAHRLRPSQPDDRADGPGRHLARRCASSTRHGRADRLVRAAWPGLGGLPARRTRRAGSGASCHRRSRASRHLDRPAVGVPPWIERGSGRRLVRSKDRSGSSGRLGTWRCRRASDQPPSFVGQTAERGRLSPGRTRMGSERSTDDGATSACRPQAEGKVERETGFEPATFSLGS